MVLYFFKSVQSQVKSYQRLKKMVLNASLLYTQHYKVQIKGKVEQFRERSSTCGVVGIEKGAFGSPTLFIALIKIGLRRVNFYYIVVTSRHANIQIFVIQVS